MNWPKVHLRRLGYAKLANVAKVVGIRADVAVRLSDQSYEACSFS